LIRSIESESGLDTNEVNKLWKRWQLAVPILRPVDSVEVYVVNRLLDPDSAKVRLAEEYLMSICPSNQDNRVD
jgi:hypothetical protein